MKKKLKQIGILNMVMLAVLLILCILLLLGGVPGVASWLVIVFALPFNGLLNRMVSLIRIFLKRKKQTTMAMVLSFIVSVIYILPILILANIVSIAYPANIKSVKPSVTVQWPLKEQTVVGWGGDTIEKNRPHAMWGNERWGYDLVMEPHATENPDLESYGIWNKEVVSPVQGTVIAAYDKEKDISPNQDEFLSYAGNYVYIKIEETGTYLMLVHLKQDSVVVSVGDTVSPGQLLGMVGNSGTSSEPHLHIHHQRQDPTKILHPLFAESLPLYFENAQDIAMPEKGMRIDP